MRITAIGPRPADDAWEQYTRTSAWPQWAPWLLVRAYAPLARLALRRLVAGCDPETGSPPESPHD